MAWAPAHPEHFRIQTYITAVQNNSESSVPPLKLSALLDGFGDFQNEVSLLSVSLSKSAHGQHELLGNRQ
jgi:hypothetical protein